MGIKFDMDNRDQQLIIAAMANMVEKGATAREVFELLNEIKQNTFFALRDMEKDNAGD